MRLSYAIITIDQDDNFLHTCEERRKIFFVPVNFLQGELTLLKNTAPAA